MSKKEVCANQVRDKVGSQEDSSDVSLQSSQLTEGIQADGTVIIGEPLDSCTDENPEKITATFEGMSVEVDATSGQTILDSLLAAGQNPPYSCMSGVCTACMAKLESGCIQQLEPGSLCEENFNEQELLTCQAVPLSKRVKVRFISEN